jgi:pimeloyl-ACP methyl ester carboxylesterase
MARDYAAMIRREFGGPVDIIGISTGGGIALHFTADYPELVRRLIIHSSAHTLGDRAKEVQMEIARLIEKGRYNKAWTELMKMVLPHRGSKGVFTWPLIGLVALIMSMSAPKDPQDAVVTLEAEDKYAFFGRLGEVTAPVLVVGGTADAFYPEGIPRQTDEGLPNGEVKLYPGQSHVAGGPAFRRDVLQFLGQRVVEPLFFLDWKHHFKLDWAPTQRENPST